MDDRIAMVVEPLVRRGLFESAERAVREMASEYILHQIERYRSAESAFQVKYSMTYAQFQAYLKSRGATLAATSDPALNRAFMTEEEDALDWKVAREMLQAWLGLEAEVST